MLKLFLIFSILSFNKPSYIKIEKIEAIQSNEKVKEIRFEVISSNYHIYDLQVEIDLYHNKVYRDSYSNSLKGIGNKKVKAKIDFNIDGYKNIVWFSWLKNYIFKINKYFILLIINIPFLQN